MIEMCNFDLSGLKGRNNWLKDYYENKECNNQISMFDFLEV